MPEDHDASHEGRTQIGKAVVLIVVAAVIAVLVLRHNPASPATTTSSDSSTTSTSAPPKTTRTTPAPLVAPAHIEVQVLNGLQSGSLAGNLSTTLHSKYGYQTLAPLNTSTITHTSAIYIVAHHFYREGKVLAGKLGVPDSIVHRGVPAAAPVPSGVAAKADLIVVIGTSLQAKAGS